jgi:hypothetical protein
MPVNTILGMPIIKELGMLLPNFRTAVVACDHTAATFDIRYHKTCCGFHANAAATFANLSVEDMCPSLLASSLPNDEPIAAPPSDHCVAATDNRSQGFLQSHLCSLQQLPLAPAATASPPHAAAAPPIQANQADQQSDKPRPTKPSVSFASTNRFKALDNDKPSATPSDKPSTVPSDLPGSEFLRTSSGLLCPATQVLYQVLSLPSTTSL